VTDFLFPFGVSHTMTVHSTVSTPMTPMALSCTVVLARSERYRLSSSTIRSGIDPSSDPAGLMANHARATD